MVSKPSEASELIASERSRELILAAAEAFTDGRSPFETEWLVEHEVTADECMALSASLGMAGRLFVYVAKNAKNFDLPGIPGSRMPTPEFQTLINFFLEELKELAK